MTSAPDQACAELGARLLPSEARLLAVRLGGGASLSTALASLPSLKRAEVRELLESTGLTGRELVPLLWALSGVGARRSSVTPAWTLPGVWASHGGLTSSIGDVVRAARSSLTCSTYNFQRSSVLWDALGEVCRRGTVHVRLYVDGEVLDSAWPGQRADDLRAQFRGARIFASRSVAGARVRNHAKVVAVDRQFLVVTSANFSESAEERNVEFGLRLANPELTVQVEDQLMAVEGELYEEL